MNKSRPSPDEGISSPEYFRQCVDYTARQTGFQRALVEKDYYCSILLKHLNRHLPACVMFKGGTCVSKVYSNFYRLSEDIDYSIPTALAASRGTRRDLIGPVKRACSSLAGQLPEIYEIEPLRGFNQSSQYIGVWGYRSCISGIDGKIKVEFGLREPSLMPEVCKPARTLMLNAITGDEAVPGFVVRAMALPEIWAEKARAAMTRREAAIRDFFDLDCAVRNLGLKPAGPAFIRLVRKKLAVPGNEPINLSGERRAELDRQVEAELKPVVRSDDYARFSLERIWNVLIALARTVPNVTQSREEQS